jgi:LuxR family transcriptional regulator
MKSWQEDLLGITDSAQSEHAVFSKIHVAAQALGFEHCAYGLRAPYPLANPQTFILNNYPVPWQQRYGSQNYLEIDPTVSHGRRTHAPLVWSNKVFRSTRQLWDEAQSFGLRVGWSQSNFDAVGVGGMLTLSRSGEALSDTELADKEFKMHWLVNVSHLALSRILVPRLTQQSTTVLTAREIEILRWSADGKTSSEVSDILAVSENTVNFHVKNAISKLQAPNKTSAVVRAAMLGLLN